MMTATAINAYNKIDIESGVNAADPHKLILMLYQGALLATISAKNQILRKETAAKGASISKAIAIIDGGLKACLDMSAGGELAQNLYSLYDYISQRLILANQQNDTSILDEVNQLLTDLKGAWGNIRPEVASALPTIAPANGIPAATSQAFIAQSITTTPPQSTTGRHATSAYGSV